MEPEGLMPHSQGLSNNPYSEPNQPNYSYTHIHRTQVQSFIYCRDLREDMKYMVRSPKFYWLLNI